MSWMRLESNFRGHPKVTALARKLGIARVSARGHLVTLWTWTMEYAPDGCLEAFSDDVIEESAEWEGAPGVFVAALKETKLLDVTEVGAEIHDWMDYAGSYKEAKRKADERAQRSKPTPVQTEVADAAGLSRTIPPRARADVRTYVQDERTESAEREADASSPPPSVSGASVAPQSSDDRTSTTIASHLEAPPLEQDYASPEHESGDPPAESNGRFVLPATARTKPRKKAITATDVDPVMRLRAQRVIDLWNQRTAHVRLPPAAPFGEQEKRDKDLVARLHKHDDRDDAWWQLIIDDIADDPGQNGSPNRDGSKPRWRTQFHWLVASEKVLGEKHALAATNKRPMLQRSNGATKGRTLGPGEKDFTPQHLNRGAT